jgi:membrane associated rhomboid family serine protease
MFPKITPVVRALLYVNFIVYAAQRLTGYGGALLDYFALWPLGGAADHQPPFEPWQLITYGFLHDPRSSLHIISNMFALWMFGPAAEAVLGSRRFAFYYFACVVGAALAQLFIVPAIPAQAAVRFGETFGASGGVMGLLVLFGLAFPNQRIYVYFALPMPAWVFVTLYGVFELWLGVFGSSDGVAHFGHLGGMATGVLLFLLWRDDIRSRAAQFSQLR